MDTSLRFITDPAVVKGVAVAAVIGAVGAGTNETLNQVAGPKRQSGDKGKIFFNLSRDSSRLSSAQISAKLGYGKEEEDEVFSNKLMVLFSDHDDYKEERSRNFIHKIHAQNPECGIKKKTWNTRIHMDVFQAFGAPGHCGVHAGLMIAYHGLEEWFVTISIDLQNIPADQLINCELPENVTGSDVSANGNCKCYVEHCLRVVKGVDDSTWEYKGSANMSLLDLFSIVANAMKEGAERGYYTKLGNNCIHFKNDILATIELNAGHRKIPNKATEDIEEFELIPIQQRGRQAEGGGDGVGE